MDTRYKHLAEHLMKKPFADLTDRDRRVLLHMAERKPVARDPAQHDDTLGGRIADKVASFGGSWTFIGLFALVLVSWVALNGFLLTHPPDPFPFIFLNLVLSMVAAFQAPIIMMSQNRQAQKDRDAAANDYEVNLKSELEIMRIHEKLDELRLTAVEERLQAIDTRIAAIADDLAVLCRTLPPRDDAAR
ncbi:hypothetical protein BVG79_00264 [Ketogulonicigenium robustum]|uniref:DUF1003 domain-containing protein n=1 Tax=Ketogulonicigenium robustum TaxID=92947 RepID=A0A1W6NWN8_9RHOB|nr:DUF1003 domain-containing protein [Ketogulonicigenium robustum]ARO13624.1 hypothetical protein BVG79_00264 [Ketogulonicigenium robustum]